jgi:hypothetical protein
LPARIDPTVASCTGTPIADANIVQSVQSRQSKPVEVVAGSARSVMKEFAIIAAILIAYLLLTQWLLPKLGVPT